MDTLLITGSAGFIGFHVSRALLKAGYTVVGYDNMNDYYDPNLKKARTDLLKSYDNFIFYEADICDISALEEVVRSRHIDAVIHLAAQAGVRYSLECPEKYIDTNIVGTFRILEVCRKYHIRRLMYASSSSVYGEAETEKLGLDVRTDSPVSLYAATKKCDEVLVHAYCNNYKLNAIGMRFFTVYGPFGRPDMAYYKFIDKILLGETIEIFNYGKQYRDFTYIDDLLDGIIKLFHFQEALEEDAGDYRIFNIGNGDPVELMAFIETIEKVIGKEAKKVLCEKRTGDVERTFADLSELQKVCDYHPKTKIEEGLRKFYEWYREYCAIDAFDDKCRRIS